MESEISENSLLGHLRKVKDPRRREGRIYPLAGMLGMMVLAGINGQKTLRSMYLWGAKRWGKISRPLGFTGQAHPPTYGTVWYALQKLEIGNLEQETRQWASEINQNETEGWSIDGKVLRGSRREDPQQAAVQVVTMVAQTLKRVMGQQIAEGGDQTEATLQLLRAVPLQGKCNEAQVKKAVDEWIEAKIFPPGRPDSG
jgi:hypothetical protein